MRQREIEITIKPNGDIELHLQGYKGKSCLEAIAYFEKIVGFKREVKYTSEFYEPDETVRFFIQNKNRDID
ncbi:MAG: DUF2997 domain-containing protein [Verrucomicrobiia bacterium]